MAEGELKDMQTGGEQTEFEDAGQQAEQDAGVGLPLPEAPAGEEAVFTESAVAAPEEVVEEVKEPTRFQLFLRKALRWAAGVAVVFVAGVVVTWLVRVTPLQNELAMTQSDLGSAQQEVATLQADVDELQTDRDELEAENADLQDQLTTALADQHILRVIADVSAARVALADDDVVTAKAALSGTEDRLQALFDILPQDVHETLQDMLARLLLVLDEIDEDNFAASKDLEVLWTNMQALERSLFQ